MNTSTLKLSGQIIAVTGAGYDIGRALSLAFARLGATLILIDKSTRALNQVYDEILAAESPEPIIAELDLSKFEEPAAQFLASQVHTQFGRLDALVHAAEWAFPLAPLLNQETETLDKAHAQLCLTPWILTKALLPVMSHAETARVVFSVLEAAKCNKPYWGAYSAALSSLKSTVTSLGNELNNNTIEFSFLAYDRIETQVRRKHYPAEDPATLTSADDPDFIERYLLLLAQSAR